MHSILRKRVVKAAGSAMDVFPVTDYTVYTSRDSSNVRIYNYWKTAGVYLEKAAAVYVTADGQIRILENGEKSQHSKKVSCKLPERDTEERYYA
ncbi:MAG: hypothetical protein ACK4VV_07960 [Pseudomonas sp.]